jgi:uncharacterized protein
MPTTYITPGVYINEVNAFPNSVVGVATAIPAFIGYTPKAELNGASVYNKPIPVSSFAEFKSIFLLDDSPASRNPIKQYSPQYYLVALKDGEHLSDTTQYVNGKAYALLPDPNSIYYLYNSIRLFYENGGGLAYVVALGGYGPVSNTPLPNASAPLVNPNVKLTDLQRGLTLLQNESAPTLYVCPEATLLSVDENALLMQSMLQQAETMQTAMCLFDVIGGKNPDPILYTNDIQTFRHNTGEQGLQYGACYYPFIQTNIMQPSEIDFTNLFGGDTTQLGPLLNPASMPNPQAVNALSMIQSQSANGSTNAQLQSALLVASPTYTQIIKAVLNDANTLPTCGAIAGVYATNDNQNGVWQAPANVPIVGAVTLPLALSDEQQSSLNVDAISGKSINAIREFPNRGILIWGARTLDGNSQDWRYIQVRRTIIYIEQSIKQALQPFVFQPNNGQTWQAVQQMIASFLTGVWQQGGLQGAKATDAFSVACGLGTTMTAQDILDGYLRVSVMVAITHPAEFIVLTFDQQLQSA